MNLTLNTNAPQSTSSISSLSDLLSSTSSTSADGSVGSASSTSVSKRGDFLAALKQLQQQDPTKFKEVVTTLASEVRDQAKDATGDQAKALNSFADKLDKVASTGDLSALKPPGADRHAQGAKGYPPPPPPDGADSDGDGSSTSATAVSSSAASLKDQMVALLEKLTKEVTAATSAGASNSSTTSQSST